MPLSRLELKTLHEEIVAVFPLGELRQLCAFDLGEDFDAIAGGQNYGDAVFSLVMWAKSDEARLKALVAAACERRSNSAKLRQLHATLSAQAIAPSEPSVGLDEFPAPFKFDLTDLMRRCISELLDRRGLVGLAVPCGVDAFLPNFCERLKFELGRSNINLRQILSLQPIASSVSTAVRRIQQYTTALQTSDVICPVRLARGAAGAQLARQFWQQLQAAFQGNFAHRLIVVMVGDDAALFPPDTVLLPPPCFERADAYQWIRDITQKIAWEHVMDAWRLKMIACCPHDDPQTELLDVGLVYYHLDFTLKLLKKSPTPTAEAFLSQLD